MCISSLVPRPFPLFHTVALKKWAGMAWGQGLVHTPSLTADYKSGGDKKNSKCAWNLSNRRLLSNY